ncbi:MAG: hypothetical protein JXB26_13005 [Candidatus Aminicenantes bacterium]|nr:hypothetical protein [Candidatus Aminicenantes bacterium]
MSKQEVSYRGIARNVHWHDSPTRYKVLSFRVEVLDKDGNSDKHIPVELDLMDVVDILVDSDEVEITGTMGENGIFLPNLIRNVRTGATIESRRKRKTAKYLLSLLLPFVLGVAGLILSRGSSRGGAAGGLITGAIIGCGLCIVLWILMAVFDSRRKA